MDGAQRFAKQLSLAHCHAPARPMRERTLRAGSLVMPADKNHRLWFIRSGAVAWSDTVLRGPATWIQRAGDADSATVTTTARIATATFSARLANHLDVLADLESPLRIQHGDASLISGDWDRALHAARASVSDPWARVRLRGAFVVLLADTIAAGFREGQWRLVSAGQPEWLQKVLHHCHDHLDHPQLDVDSLATISGLSPSRFAHAFRAAMSCPPKQHLENLRLERVCALLRTSHLSIKEIAVACGFRDADHCGERFRAAHGCAPSAWRTKQELG